MGRPGGPGPLDPIFDVPTSYGAIATGNTPGAAPLFVTINLAPGQDDAIYTNPIYDVVFSEAVTGFATGDVTLSGTAGATTGTVVDSGDHINFTVTVTGMTDCGTVIADIAAGVAFAILTGLGNAASTSTDNEVDFLIAFADDFNRANGGLGGGWGSYTGMFVDTNKAYANGANRFAVWGTDSCVGVDQFAQFDTIVNGNFIAAGPAVRMDAASSSYYYGTANSEGYAIGKRVGGSFTGIAGATASIANGTYTLYLGAVDAGSLGTVLCLYTVSGGVPTVIVAGHDSAASDLQYNKIGFTAGIDTVTFPGGTTVGDNWSGGAFSADDGIHDIPRMVGGWATLSGGIWNHEFQPGTTDELGIRDGGSMPAAWLCVAGGGGGGGSYGGPGGAGGVRFGSTTFSTTKTVITGAGGNRGWPSSSNATSGGDSSISGLTSCTGGGNGQGVGVSSNPVSNGGSGGALNTFSTGAGGTGVAGEGNNGGGGDGGFTSGSGGGAGAAGLTANGSLRAGGAGLQWPTASGGDDAYYGGGGGGGGYVGGPGGTGGIGGGGDGGTRQAPYYAQDGTAKTGGGGGGSGGNDSGGTGSTVGGSGGTGVVKIRYINSDWVP